MLTFRITGADKLLRALADVPKKTRSNTERALTKAAHLVEKQAKQNISGPVLKVQSGTLRSSIRTKVDKAKLEARVGTNVVYGPIHEFGGTIPPHIVKPRHAKVLRWLGPGGIAMFAKSVQMPAVKMPRRAWLGPAFKQSAAKIKDIFRKAISGAIGDASK